MPRIQLRGTLTVPADRIEAVAKALPLHIQLTRAEPGCLHFDVTEDPSNPGLFSVDELFVDQSAFDAHQLRAGQSDWASVTQGLPRDYTITEIST
ncbi:putative quinol monooxygenase [uncultured Shimia sp.]|uniref:putative quinol monooxygenase n=1 Tax=uncultured Shimia sp. TaxID=573152 RepID=UPI0026194053|nr:putative quinol monooxygenase [uncultured Shimia sp.]